MVNNLRISGVVFNLVTDAHLDGWQDQFDDRNAGCVGCAMRNRSFWVNFQIIERRKFFSVSETLDSYFVAGTQGHAGDVAAYRGVAIRYGRRKLQIGKPLVDQLSANK